MEGDHQRNAGKPGMAKQIDNAPEAETGQQPRRQRHPGQRAQDSPLASTPHAPRLILHGTSPHGTSLHGTSPHSTGLATPRCLHYGVAGHPVTIAPSTCRLSCSPRAR